MAEDREALLVAIGQHHQLPVARDLAVEIEDLTVQGHAHGAPQESGADGRNRLGHRHGTIEFEHFAVGERQGERHVVPHYDREVDTM